MAQNDKIQLFEDKRIRTARGWSGAGLCWR